MAKTESSATGPAHSASRRFKMYGMGAQAARRSEPAAAAETITATRRASGILAASRTLAAQIGPKAAASAHSVLSVARPIERASSAGGEMAARVTITKKVVATAIVTSEVKMMRSR